MDTQICVSLLLIAIMAVCALLVLAAAALRVVPEHQRLVVFRLGRFMGVNGPGLLFLMPFVDRAVVVDLRERVKKIEGETLTTRDEKRVVVDVVWSYKVVDAAHSVLEVENLESAMREMVVTELRAVVGGLARGEVMTAREQARDEMHRRLGEIVEAWGVEMGQVEIGEVRRGQR